MQEPATDLTDVTENTDSQSLGSSIESISIRVIRGGSFGDQRLQRVDILLIVTRFIDGRFCDESSVCRTRVVQQTPERLQSDAAFANVLMAIELRCSRGFGIVAMPNWDVPQPDSVLQICHRVLVAVGRNDVVPGNMRMAGIDTGGDREHRAQTLHQLRNLLEGATQGVLCTCRILD